MSLLIDYISIYDAFWLHIILTHLTPLTTTVYIYLIISELFKIINLFVEELTISTHII